MALKRVLLRATLTSQVEDMCRWKNIKHILNGCPFVNAVDNTGARRLEQTSDCVNFVIVA
jgi:hypothetical protein